MEDRSRTNYETRAAPTSPQLSQHELLIGQALDAYREIYPTYGEALSPQKISLFCDLLADLDPDDLKAGLADAPKTCKHFPTPAHIRECADAAMHKRLEIARNAASERRQRLAAASDVDCDQCNDTGFVTALKTATVRGRTVTVSVATPCKCRPWKSRGLEVEAGEWDQELAGEVAEAAQGRTM